MKVWRSATRVSRMMNEAKKTNNIHVDSMTSVYPDNIYLKFSQDSEASASVSWENLRYMFSGWRYGYKIFIDGWYMIWTC